MTAPNRAWLENPKQAGCMRVYDGPVRLAFVQWLDHLIPVLSTAYPATLAIIAFRCALSQVHLGAEIVDLDRHRLLVPRG